MKDKIYNKVWSEHIDKVLVQEVKWKVLDQVTIKVFWQIRDRVCNQLKRKIDNER